MKFICPTHGEVKPKIFLYSCPLCAKCPYCGKTMRDRDDKGIKVLTEEESRLKRPELYDEDGNFKKGERK